MQRLADRCIERYAAWREKRVIAYARNLQEELVKNDFRPHVFLRIPYALRGDVLQRLPGWLTERADAKDEDLAMLIRNVRMCGGVISREEEVRLYTIAMVEAHGTQKIRFARMIYDDHLPLDIVLDILRKTPEPGSFLQNQDHSMKLLLQEVDMHDQLVIKAFLEVIVRDGRYRHLKSACRLLQIHIPQKLLRMCFEVMLHRTYDPADAMEACIALQDWTCAERFINEWADDKQKRLYAAELALAMHLAHKRMDTS